MKTNIRWVKAILLGVLTLITIIACSSQPEVETNQNAANAPVAELKQLEFGVGPYFPTPNKNRQ